MEIKRINFRKHILWLLVPLVMVIGVASYYRFIVNQDYLVGYEGVCDPATEKCFKGCEDDACTKEYYYSEMTKYAPDLYRECGKDITDCEAASVCLPDDRKCSVTYDNQVEPAQEKPLQNNNINDTNI